MENVCVSAICLNESKNILQWLEHVGKADRVVLVDTGSSDNTVQLAVEYAAEHAINLDLLTQAPSDLRNLGQARNLAHSLYSDGDLIVWLDLDERFSDPDWVEVLRSEAMATPQASAFNITMHNGDSTYFQVKAYRSGQYVWRYRAHEVLNATPSNPFPYSHDVVGFHTDHYPDGAKSRDYLPELEADVKHNLDDARPLFYYARELCYRIIYADEYSKINAARTAISDLSRLPHVWSDYVALANIELAAAEYRAGHDVESQKAAYRAVAARPDRIETLAMAASVFEFTNDIYMAKAFALRGLEATDGQFLFKSVESNTSLCFGVLSRVSETLGDKDRAMFYAVKYAESNNEDPITYLTDRGLINTQESNNGEGNAEVSNSTED